MVMLPSSTNWLLAKWTGPYAVEEVLSSTTYKVAIPQARKNHQTFHINMLSRWDSPSAVCLLNVGEISNAEPDFPLWRVENTADIKPHMDPTLKALEEYKAARGIAAGRTDRATMRIETGPALPSSSPPYRLAHARKPIVQEEIKEMLHDGIIQPSHSPWAAPMVLLHDGIIQPSHSPWAAPMVLLHDGIIQPSHSPWAAPLVLLQDGIIQPSHSPWAAPMVLVPKRTEL